MKKIIALALTLLFAFGMISSAYAEDVTVTMFQLKVEIDAALQEFAKQYNASHPGVTVNVETLGGGADYHGALKAKLQADQMPSIFVIEGKGGYDVWKDNMADMADCAWVKDTDFAFMGDDGKVVGFPVAVEGFGLGYNAEILEKAGIDPATLTTFSAVKAAFEKLDGMKAELGLDAVTSMAASIAGGMWWVMGNHNFNAYYAGGIGYEDTTYLDMALKGEVDADRLAAYANYAKLLFDYADQDILTNGNYDAQVSAFAQGKTAFINQGNWIDPNMKQMDASFKMGYISHCFTEEETTGLFMAAPSWYCLNGGASEAEQKAAKDFLDYMATTPEGADYMVNQAGMVPAFKSVTLKPTGQFSAALVEASARGGNYNWRFGSMPDGFAQNHLGPVFDLFAQDHSDVNVLIQDLTDTIAKAPTV
ncbi:ABC transporter substrate-binding protein [Bacillota bacterium Meth-B3]|nr:ABC transporter substrate-binding protein [Christensenellaceae bacterium]MEA5066039.1 ABC transporter substrate-binding protein [Eubacteriales bacterium]MEA5068140.1 ABC transporter substrate-binding protein [Christensenellaceae bacterium]